MEELTKEEKKNKVKAGVATGVILSLLFLLMVLFGFTAPEKIGEENDLMVDMANSASSSSSTPETTREVPVQPVSPPAQEHHTTNQEEGENVATSPKPSPKPTKPTPTPPQEPQRQIDPALNDLFKNSPKSPGQGPGNNPGNNPGDGPNDNGPGQGPGAGTGGDGFKLGSGFGNRAIKSYPAVTSNCVNSKGGKLVLEIEVNPAGDVVNIIGVARGGNINDACLIDEGKKLVKRIKLQPTSGVGNTRGEITVTFKN